MDPQIWTDVAVDVQTALATALPITGITKGAVTTVAATAHGLANGTPVLLRVSGVASLDFVVAKVENTDSGDFDIAIDSTDMKGTFVSGSIQAITFGASASTFQEITPSGGETEDVLISTIHRNPNYSIPGKPSPLVFSFGSLWVVDDPALVELHKASRAKTVRAVRFQWPDGTEALFAGIPSVSMAPGGSSGAPVTTTAKINVRGLLTPYPGDGA